MDESNIVSGFVKALLEKYAEPIAKGVADFAKDEWEKFKIDFDFAFSKYIENAYDKYSKVKTILYKTEPKYIYDFFECPYLRKGQSKPIKADDIECLLDTSNFIIVQGTGGIGKSTFLKHLFSGLLDFGSTHSFDIEFCRSPLPLLHSLDKVYSF